MTIKQVLITSMALLAFAGNSVLCRMALGDGLIDAASFTTVRLLSGIAVLAAILLIRRSPRKQHQVTGSWSASLMLFLYAITFSFAYVSLNTGTGALILFAAVQMSMILSAVLSGKKLYLSEWSGIALAMGGLVYLLLPALGTPSLFGFVLMSIA